MAAYASELSGWTDRRRPFWLISLLLPMLPLASLAAWRAFGGEWLMWLTPLLIYGLVPVLDLVLYQLQRHSDHHAWPARRYQALRHFDEAPQLPTGYFGMFLVAMVPPLWRRIMDPRVLEHAAGDGSRINGWPGREA